MSHQHNFAPRALQHQHQQAQGATGHEGSYNEPSASTSTMDPFATSNENDYNDMNPLQHIGIHGNRDTLDWLINTYGAPSQTNLGHSVSPSHTISPSIYSSLNTPAEHMGASPYLPTPNDYPSHPFHSGLATAASGGNPSLFAQTSSSPLVHAHPSHFVSTSTIPQWHSPTQDSILSSSAPASMSPLHYTSHNQHHQHQQPQARFGGGSASANTSPFGPQLYQPTPAPGQIGPSLFQNNPLTLPPHPPLTNVTHSPLTTSGSGGLPPRPLTNPASLQIPGAHHVPTEPVSASTPLDASSLSLFPLSQSSSTSSGSSTSAGTAGAAGAPASEPPHAYLARNTAHLSPEHREIVEKKWSVWANDPIRQRKVVDILVAWYGTKQRPSNADLMFFHRKIYGNESNSGLPPLSSHHGATSSIDSQDDVFSAPSTSAAAMNSSSSAVAVGSSSNNRRGGGAGTRGGPIGYECEWPNGGCANPLKARADRIQEDALIHLGIKTHICEPCGSDFLRKNELTRHQKTCKSHNASLNTQEDATQFNGKGGRAKETPRRGSGPSISPISSRFPNAVRKNLDRSLRGISSSEPPAESGAISGADSFRGGRNSLDSAVFAPMAPGGANGDIGGNSSSSSTQVSPVNTRDMTYFAGDVNGHPPTPQQPGEAPQQRQQAQGAMSLFRNNSVGRSNRLVMTGAPSGGDQTLHLISPTHHHQRQIGIKKEDDSYFNNMAMVLDEPTEGFTMPSGRQGPTFPTSQQIPSSSSQPLQPLFVNGDFQVPSQSRAAVSQLTGSFPNPVPMPRSTVTPHAHARTRRTYPHRRDMSQDTAGSSSSRMSISPPYRTSTMYSPTHTQQAQHTQSRQLSPSSHYPNFLATMNDANQYSPPTNTSLTFPTPITMPAPLLSFPSVPSHSNVLMNHSAQQQQPSPSHHSFQQQQR